MSEFGPHFEAERIPQDGALRNVVSQIERYASLGLDDAVQIVENEYADEVGYHRRWLVSYGLLESGNAVRDLFVTDVTVAGTRQFAYRWNGDGTVAYFPNHALEPEADNGERGAEMMSHLEDFLWDMHHSPYGFAINGLPLNGKVRAALHHTELDRRTDMPHSEEMRLREPSPREQAWCWIGGIEALAHRTQRQANHAVSEAIILAYQNNMGVHCRWELVWVHTGLEGGVPVYSPGLNVQIGERAESYLMRDDAHVMHWTSQDPDDPPEISPEATEAFVEELQTVFVQARRHPEHIQLKAGLN